jgi:hypothetical protein
MFAQETGMDQDSHPAQGEGAQIFFCKLRLRDRRATASCAPFNPDRDQLLESRASFVIAFCFSTIRQSKTRACQLPTVNL